MNSIEIILNLVKDGCLDVDKAIILIEELYSKHNVTWIPNTNPGIQPYNPEPYKIWCNSYQTSKTDTIC